MRCVRYFALPPCQYVLYVVVIFVVVGYDVNWEEETLAVTNVHTLSHGGQEQQVSLSMWKVQLQSTNNLTLMLLVANFPNTKKSEKWLKPRHMGTYLRVHSESYPMNTTMTGLRWFSKIFAFLSLVTSALELKPLSTINLILIFFFENRKNKI